MPPNATRCFLLPISKLSTKNNTRQVQISKEGARDYTAIHDAHCRIVWPAHPLSPRCLVLAVFLPASSRTGLFDDKMVFSCQPKYPKLLLWLWDLVSIVVVFFNLFLSYEFISPPQLLVLGHTLDICRASLASWSSSFLHRNALHWPWVMTPTLPISTFLATTFH